MTILQSLQYIVYNKKNTTEQHYNDSDTELLFFRIC